MGKRKEYRKIIKNYKEQKIVFQEEMKLDYSKLEETIAEAIKIEKERENENKRKHSKKRELLYKTLNIIFYMVLMIIVLSLLYSICMAFISGKIDDIVGFLITIATLIIIIIIMHSLCLKNTTARRSYLRLRQCPKNSPKPRTFP